jgi:hypothetical protein
MIRTPKDPAKTRGPFSLSLRHRYRLADLCQWLEICDTDQNLLIRILFSPDLQNKKATAAGTHILVTGENFIWAVNLLSSQMCEGLAR